MKQSRQMEFEDVQGIVRFAYNHLKRAGFLLLQVKNREAAREWLKTAPVTNAVKLVPPPKRTLQIALSSQGLGALGVADAIVQGFSVEFVAGMSGDANRSSRLGDIGESDPGHWQWGSAPNNMPHVLVMLYAEPDDFEQWQQQILEQCAAGFTVIDKLDTEVMNGREPFGFIDGISQPDIDWQGERVTHYQQEIEYTNLSCLGEFLLGYSNEYSGYTGRPLLDEQSEGASNLPKAEDAPDKADLGRNGTYLVFRHLKQDVRQFWRFMDAQAGGDAARRQHLAEAMVGRTLPEGKPLAALTDKGLNDFDYQGDSQGFKCPFGAHIRRANPRNPDLPSGQPGWLAWLWRNLGFDAKARRKDIVASTRFHRLLRRGRKYGKSLSIDQALTPAEANEESGLYFICLNSSIVRQFEFVQTAWIMGTRFDGLNREGDPLLGHRQPDLAGAPSDGFSIPQANAPDEKLCGLPRFITVRGGAYFFLPGIRALRYLVSTS